MKLVATMPVRNEAWCLGLTLRAALQWCDAVVVLLHACSDGSEAIVRQAIADHKPGRIRVLQFLNPTWDEMDHRQTLLREAREAGATHIAIIDADELITANLAQAIRPHCEGAPRGSIIELPGYNLRNGIMQYHENGIWGKRWFSTAFRDIPILHWGGDKFHSREPAGAVLDRVRPIHQGAGGIMHLWGASERRLKAKSALYKLTERVRWPNKPVPAIDVMYSWAIHGQRGHASYGTPATWTYASVPEAWWAGYEPWLKYLDIDAVPWQESECRRIVAKHGTEITHGLDLFGVI